MNEEVKEEIEALLSIYEDDMEGKVIWCAGTLQKNLLIFTLLL